ncbi:NmrA-like family domain-containing protein 1 [Pseudocercospora fuligena]|uniref:NmrA-like family domain-containing protein 1 n=1 Tax=Pseudocercospora fuligena TaxID=685502 RepID=A0A8H6RTH3_9PEZI|nr:NmrA-like family domain-containing protein 1 [Pseudocercospora fuligena]
MSSSDKKILLIFGATGNQGGSIIDLVLKRPDLSSKYALRGISRDPNSSKSQSLTNKGVEMVKADLDDISSLKTAMEGAYGVFGVTDFWSLMDKNREIQQGKNIFEAAKDTGVKHLVWSSLPNAEKVSGGNLKHADHFDGKAMVEEYIEANKGDMIASYFLPAMFITFAKTQINPGQDGKPTLAMPFPSDDVAWPLIDPRRDGGKYVMGLFEGGAEANGAKAHGVSTWTTPKEIVAALSKISGREVKFQKLPAEVFAGFLPENIREELLETMLLVGDHSYYGKGEEKKQEKSDKWLIEGENLLSFEDWAQQNGPWKW